MEINIINRNKIKINISNKCFIIENEKGTYYLYVKYNNEDIKYYISSYENFIDILIYINSFLK